MTTLGRLGAVSIAAANTAEVLCTVDGTCIVNVLACNRGSADATIRIAVTTGGAPANADWIEYDVVVAGNQPMERTGLALSTGEKIYVQASNTNFSFRAHGVPAT